MTIELIEPDWPAPTQVRAGTTTRLGGVSLGGFESLNLAEHVEDDPHAVAENRKRLSLSLGLPGEPFWLTQIHGCDIALGERDSPGCQADGVY
ncbi:MAG: laccase domain-containing protein, partial [Candidatus Thiodiazotropha taylori]